MKRDNRIIVELRFLERLTCALHEIFNRELHRPVSMGLCCRTVIAAMSIGRHEGLRNTGHYLGRPWSTQNAISFLAGMGHVFEPRLVYAAVRRIEDRYIIDTCRMAYSRPRRPRLTETRAVSDRSRFPHAGRHHAAVLKPTYKAA